MAEYIERESLLEDIKQYSYARIDNGAIDKMGFQFVKDMASIQRIIEKQPAADVVEVKHGEWVEFEDNFLDTLYQCSVCKEDFVIIEGTPSENLWKYCPNCGAKMDKKEGADNGNGCL